MVYIVLGDGFEEMESVIPFDILKRGGVEVQYVAAGSSLTVEGSHGIKILADCLAADVTGGRADTFFVPGGLGGVKSIKASEIAMQMLAKAHENGCTLAAICAGPSVLAELGLLEGRHITCYPGCENMMGGAICHLDRPVVMDGGLITGRSAGSTFDFALTLLSLIKSETAAQRVADDIVFRRG